MRKIVGLFLSLSVAFLGLGCPNPGGSSDYEGSWELSYDWYCSGTYGESIVDIFGNGDLAVTDLSDDVEDKAEKEAAVGRASDGNPYHKGSFSGTWEFGSETGLLVMHVGPLDVQYHVTYEDEQILSGDMYQDGAYVGCFTMVRSDGGTYAR